MRGLAVVLAVVALLAGCLEEERSQETVPPVEEGPEPTFEPVSIHEEIDLLEGLPMTEWNFTFGPGATGTIQARLQGPDDLVTQRVGGGFCFRYEITHETGFKNGRNCASSGAVSVSSGSSVQLLDHTLAQEAGQASLQFGADPQAARFLLDVEITYT